MYILLLNLLDNVYIITDTKAYQKVRKEVSIDEFIIPIACSNNLIHLEIISQTQSNNN